MERLLYRPHRIRCVLGGCVSNSKRRSIQGKLKFRRGHHQLTRTQSVQMHFGKQGEEDCNFVLQVGACMRVIVYGNKSHLYINDNHGVD